MGQRNLRHPEKMWVKSSSVELFLVDRSPSRHTRILLGWPDTDDKRGIDFRVFDLHIFHNHAVDTDDDFR
jgi:hypothetical protein